MKYSQIIYYISYDYTIDFLLTPKLSFTLCPTMLHRLKLDSEIHSSEVFLHANSDIQIFTFHFLLYLCYQEFEKFNFWLFNEVIW